jgi:hypothetical protein
MPWLSAYINHKISLQSIISIALEGLQPQVSGGASGLSRTVRSQGPGRYLLLQDHLTSIDVHAHRRCVHRHIQTNECTIIAHPSDDRGRPTSIRLLSEKGDASLIVQSEPPPQRYTILTEPTAGVISRDRSRHLLFDTTNPSIIQGHGDRYWLSYRHCYSG